VSQVATRAVPLVDLSRLNVEILAQAQEAFARLSRSGAFTFGEELEAFEAEFAEYCDAAHCVGVGDGTDALRLALVAMGVGPGSEVITVSHTFVATVEAIAATGADPVFVDVDPATRCMDPARLAAAITPRTAAVVAVHLYGRPAPMNDILAAAGDLPVLEDAAQSHGAELHGQRTGSLGAAAGFSFYPTKNLGAMGDGGAVVTDDPDLAAAVRSLRHHGADPQNANLHLRRGSTARLDNLQAALLRLKLPHLDSWNESRRAAAARYRTALADLPVGLPPADPKDGRHVYHLFVVEVDDRDRVLAEMREAGIGAAAHYPTPIHLQPAWRALGFPEGSLPYAEEAASRCLTLPLFPEIAEAEIDHVVETLADVLSRS
jgi:dTDP-4-amino-4,6-dideoxygalactose transaminase